MTEHAIDGGPAPLTERELLAAIAQAKADYIAGVWGAYERYQDCSAELERLRVDGETARAPVPCKWPDCARGNESPPRGKCECSLT